MALDSPAEENTVRQVFLADCKEEAEIDRQVRHTEAGGNRRTQDPLNWRVQSTLATNQHAATQREMSLALGW